MRVQRDQEVTSFADRFVGPALGRAVRIALLFVGIAPFLPMLLGQLPGLRIIGELWDSWFQFQCHREDPRSFHILGHVVPVCARCFGIYLGLGLGALVLRPRLSTWPLRIWVSAAALVMVLDVWTELLGMRPGSAWLRLITGILLSYPVGAALVIAARGDAEPEERQRSGLSV